MVGRDRARAARALHRRRRLTGFPSWRSGRLALGDTLGDEWSLSHDRHIADRPAPAPPRAAVLPPAPRDHRHLAPPRGGRRHLYPSHPELQDVRPRPPAPERRVHRPLQPVRPRLRRARGHRHRHRGTDVRGRQGLRGPPRPRAAPFPHQVPSRDLPRGSPAFRGPAAPLPAHRAAQGSARPHLRLPGIHGELRGRSELGPTGRGRQRGDGLGLRVESLRPGPREGAAARTPDSSSSCSIRSPTGSIGPHPTARRGAPSSRWASGRPTRGLLPLRRQEPALRPRGDAQVGQGQLHGRPARHRSHPGGDRQAQARFPQRAGGSDGRPHPVQRRDDGRLRRQQRGRPSSRSLSPSSS